MYRRERKLKNLHTHTKNTNSWGLLSMAIDFKLILFPCLLVRIHRWITQSWHLNYTKLNLVKDFHFHCLNISLWFCSWTWQWFSFPIISMKMMTLGSPWSGWRFILGENVWDCHLEQVFWIKLRFWEFLIRILLEVVRFAKVKSGATLIFLIFTKFPRMEKNLFDNEHLPADQSGLKKFTPNTCQTIEN